MELIDKIDRQAGDAAGRIARAASPGTGLQVGRSKDDAKDAR